MGKQEEFFNKETLTSALFCAVLMTAIDGKYDQKEWDECQHFLKDYWKDEYGSSKQFMLGVAKEVRPYLISRTALNEKIIELAGSLNLSQKEVVFSLAEKVMQADGRVLLLETELLNRFKNEFIKK